MAEPAWMNYIGPATGIIGTISGVAALLVSLSANRKANAMKSLDMRVELRRQLNVLHFEMRELQSLIYSAHSSRRSLFASKGQLESGMTKAWDTEVQRDRTALAEIEKSIPKPTNSGKLSPKELEVMLGQAHNAQIKATALKMKYEGKLQEDQNNKKELAADRRASKPPPIPPWSAQSASDGFPR